MTKLDRCWKNCLRMWKWVSENREPNDDTDVLKKRWLRQHGFKREIPANCFFCEYYRENGGGERKYRGDKYCANCPAGYVSKSFSCTSEAYSYENRPKAFYRKLLQLDAKRKKQADSKPEKVDPHQSPHKGE